MEMVKVENGNLERIFHRLTEYLLNNESFTHTGLNRGRLASLLRTNEKYLCKAVRIFGGISLGNLLEDIRVEYACMLLIKHPGYTVDAIAEESGLGSRSTFYRVFKKHKECSPDQFRHLFADKEFKPRYAFRNQ